MTDTLIKSRKRAPGAGRRPKGDSPYTVALDLRVTKEMGDSIATHARVDGMTRQDLARLALEEYLKRKQFL